MPTFIVPSTSEQGINLLPEQNYQMTYYMKERTCGQKERKCKPNHMTGDRLFYVQAFARREK